MKKIILLAILAILFFNVFATFVKDFPIKLQQPNGKIINCFVTGDEYYQRVFDENNYTIIRDKSNGYCVYAIIENDELISSGIIVGDNISKNSKIISGIDISVEKKEQIRRDKKANRPEIRPIKKLNSEKGVTLTINILTVFIKFSDSEDFDTPFSTYYSMYNDTISSSAYRYFKDASYGEVKVIADFYPIPNGEEVLAFTDIYPRSYYCPYDPITNTNGYDEETGEGTSRKEALLKRALIDITNQIPSSLDLDVDNDGYIDNINFIAEGEVTAWSTLLWPHKSNFWNENVTINGINAGTYNFHIENHLLLYNTSVITHETYHSFGVPDLYRYTYDGTPVGIWDIMAENTNPPQATAAYLKNKYTMFARPVDEIITSGTYTIKQTWNETNNCYKIKATGSDVDDEFFIVECRSKSIFWENLLPTNGLIVYRINPNHYGNAYGGDEVTVIRNNSLNTAALGRNLNRTYLSNTSSPLLNFSDGTFPNFGIFNVSNTGDSMTFDVIFNSGFSVYPKNIEFPDNSILEPSLEQTITLIPYNINGNINLQIIGPDASFFEITEFNQNIAENIIKVKFIPAQTRTYNASLKITGDSCTTIVNLTGQGIIIPLVAQFNVSSYQTATERTLQFTDKSLGTPSTWEWQFEGGTPSNSTEANPIVSYQSPGSYYVRLEVENQYLIDDTIFNYIIIENNDENLNCNYSFENWTNSFPNCWNGTKNDINSSHISKIDTNAYEGNYCCQLINGLSNIFLNFATKPVSVKNGKSYIIEFYVKGKGKIYTSLYDQRSENNGSSPNVQAIQIDTNEYILFRQEIQAKNTSDNAEFIVKVAGTNISKQHLIIDNLKIIEDTITNINNYYFINFDIFPNPSENGIFTINCEEEINIEIYNTMGILLESKNINGKQVLDLKQYSKGVYYIKAINNNNVYTTKKIIII